MRKLLIALFSITLISASLSAQINTRWQFGLKAGASVSTHDVTGEWPANPDFRTGLDVGGYVSWRFTFSTALMMEVHYLQNGHAGPDVVWDPDNSDFPPVPPDFRVDYISVPLLLRIDMPVGELPTYLLFGPHFNFKVGGDPNVTDYYADNLESFTMGGTVGFGHSWQISGKAAIFGEVQYRHDFTEAFNLNAIKLNNRAFGILVGINID